MDQETKSTLKIAIVGPESTGKSTLSEQLATHYKTVFVREYAREYLEQLDRPYTQDDLTAIAQGQIQLENNALQSANRLLFCDTNLMVIIIWSEYKYGSIAPEITQLHNYQHYDLYLLANNDTTWEYDPLREAPNIEERNRIYDIYVRYCNQSGVPYRIVSGTGADRLTNAINAVEEFLKWVLGKNRE